MKKTKNILILGLLILFLAGGYYIVSNYTSKNESNSINNEINITKLNLESPDRPAEINGSVVSVEGNVLIIANEVGVEQLTEEERAERKVEMQNLSQEERQALRQQELENTETEEVEIIIPVGVTILKGSGDASGDVVSVEISEITKGTYVSIWVTENKVPEFIKIKGLTQ
ncbi:hypothetical protein A2380_03590 [candidate division WWE3 bacterium RIFOXYB1_FULL_43_24]|uniref:Uncharacterized protein n=2 Tax=Katanobacteria TaxID=422282 RepID=A0A0G1BMX5_UNCKA|nr:MAG: hypothetical protein UU92_C0006G0032 [candidate division WWE3 bacterium GW2011_GWA1_42_12]KKS34383.1 MAG: hypothetical protein UU97_C0011G0019 [candidate division WWE3 bacterium GW2011_GWD1_42_14]KKS38843.1 MAG: hypothetical protein UV00_C0005G0026 [candidate division WWE3 bacterium GW2011_GWF1_42_14]KKS40541.1 MAG: hypothetical protein UV03_C0005G0027 [candidate division WWE3 bacterium GW2011_GWE1_42_16]KKS66950.1 MAG: hypothetical protein UV35_C0005G0031 [candidate division WWE3 bacte